ncbi:hypothetical protein B0H21DRAFT_83681 [Amylocystis lapponica]|nr:hypothetical protein B0H21DRAFT_83681 [Amylocystis lapponica]
MPSPTQKVLSAIQNIPKRRKSSPALDSTPARGKENVPPGASSARRRMPKAKPRPSLPAINSNESFIQMPDTSQKWLPQDGYIIIKVWVPSTDDVWKMKVAEDVSLDAFSARVARKVAFPVAFSTVVAGQMRAIETEEEFRGWVARRVRYGRNHLLTVHKAE